MSNNCSIAIAHDQFHTRESSEEICQEPNETTYLDVRVGLAKVEDEGAQIYVRGAIK